MFTRQQRRTKGQMVGRAVIGMARRAKHVCARCGAEFPSKSECWFHMDNFCGKPAHEIKAEPRGDQPDNPPRIEAPCQKCGEPSHQLFAAGPGLICATCKAKEKGNQ